MGSIIEVPIPDIGEKVEQGQVVGLLVTPGQTVAADQPLLEFETDKAMVEIPAPAAGVVKEIAVKVGDKVKVGTVFLRLESSNGASAPAPAATPSPAASAATPAPSSPTPSPLPPSPSPNPQPVKMSPAPSPAAAQVSGPRQLAPASPSVRRLAREVGVDINIVTGSAPHGRISEDDVKAHVKGRLGSAYVGGSIGGTAPGATPPLPDFSAWGGVRREPMNAIRSVTARAMTTAWQTVPHVTQFDQADITALEEYRQTLAHKYEKSGPKITLLPFMMTVLARGLKKYPKFNGSLDLERQELILKDYLHIGIATATDSGLLVPVVRQVDTKSIVTLAREIADLSERARHRRLSLAEMEGGSFTISNQGGIGGVQFTPIVYWPQVAILGMSRSSVQPVWQNNQFVPRTILPLALSYDHRMCDGAEAAAFLGFIAESLAHPFALFAE